MDGLAFIYSHSPKIYIRMNLKHFLVAHIRTMHTVVLTGPMCADSKG